MRSEGAFSVTKVLCSWCRGSFPALTWFIMWVCFCDFSFSSCSFLPHVYSEFLPLEGFYWIIGISLNDVQMLRDPGKGQRKSLRLSSSIYCVWESRKSWDGSPLSTHPSASFTSANTCTTVYNSHSIVCNKQFYFMMQEENLPEVYYFNSFLSIDSRTARVLLWEIWLCMSLPPFLTASLNTFPQTCSTCFSRCSYQLCVSHLWPWALLHFFGL